MKRCFILVSVIFCLIPGMFAQDFPDGTEILKKIDENITAGNKIVVSKMIVHGRRGTRTIRSKSWIQGTEKSFTEYLAPPREAGIKMLKLEDQLWTYYPSTDRTIRISGHMLRQSVMGSDLSYEDMMEDPRLSSAYRSEVTGEETIGGRPCWMLNLTAAKEDLAYAGRKLWVDKERYIALREERYARSGKLLKSVDIRKVEKRDGRWVPVHLIFKDELQRGEGTEFILESIQFDAEIPEYIFTKAALKR